MAKKATKSQKSVRAINFSPSTMLILSLIFAVVGTVTFASTFAARGGNGKGKPVEANGSISLVITTDKNADGLPNHGDLVTFNVSTTATTEPWVLLKCYQNGVLVSQGSEGFFDRALGDGILGLYSPSWTSGAADCTAELVMNIADRRPTVLASTSFHVNP